MTAGTAPVLVDAVWSPPIERSRAGLRQATLVLAFALLTAALAQFDLKLGFTPVPITGQTLGVLLAGGTLGWRLGGVSQLVYWLLGLTGLPFYASGDGGWSVGTGPTMGYFIGFVVAAATIGYLAERKHDRNLASSVSAMTFGSVIIYASGATWLAHDLDIPVATGDVNALTLGVTPFLIGDLVKVLIAGALLPAAAAMTERRR